MTEAKTEIQGIYKASEGVLINKDNAGLQNYKLRKAKENKINEFEKKIEDLQSDMSEIKILLKGLVK